jgi:hypothetical protein
MVDCVQSVNDHPDLVPYLNQLELKPKVSGFLWVLGDFEGF